MMTFLRILQACLICVGIQQVSSYATTFQECESPCVNGQTCELSCTAVSGTIITGLVFFWNNNQLVGCTNQQCSASFPIHNYTQINSTTASLHILTFSNATNGGLYECADGNGPKNGTQIYEVMNTDIPDGNLMANADPAVHGRVTCTITHVGTGNLTLTAPDETILATNASTVVTANVTDSYATCSVKWPTCPKFITRKFPPITVIITAPTTEPPVSGTNDAPNASGVPGTSVDTTMDTTMNTSVSATVFMAVGTSDTVPSIASTSSSPPSTSMSAGSGTTDGGQVSSSGDSNLLWLLLLLLIPLGIVIGIIIYCYCKKKDTKGQNDQFPMNSPPATTNNSNGESEVRKK